MSEQDTTPEPEANTEAEETTEEQPEQSQESQEDTNSSDETDWRKNFDPDKAADRIRKLQSEAKNLRERTKAAEKKAEDTDGEKDQRISTLEAELLRERVGRRLNLPDELVDRLRGDTEDDLLADAEKLVALVGPAKRPGSRRPAEQLRGGGEPEREPEETDTRKIAERMFAN